MNILYRFINWRRNIRLSFEEDVIKRSVIRSAVLLLGIIIAHVYLMTRFEAFSWQDALWLTLTTLSTTGYGDISATTLAGKTATALLLYLGGIFILAKAAGDYFEYRANIRAKKIQGHWEWHMSGHILVINTPSQQGSQFFVRLLRHINHSGLSAQTVQILTRKFPDGLPSPLSRMPGLVHYTGSGTCPNDLLAVNAQQAKYIVILAEQEDDRDSDSRTFDVLYRLQELKLRDDALVLAECVDDDNRQRFRLAGAKVIIRPMRAYPEMLIRGLVAPGSEQIIENLFSSLGDLYMRYDVSIKQLSWKDIVCQLIRQDLGTAVAYINHETGLCETNPHANTLISTESLFVMANDDKPPTRQAIQQAISAIH
jgi:voltage-gated potassium channel